VPEADEDGSVAVLDLPGCRKEVLGRPTLAVGCITYVGRPLYKEGGVCPAAGPLEGATS
jgi:hypothetical protein